MAVTKTERLPLSRDRILRAALELADEHGIESVTMRKLGEALGFEAMSLYNHVANKDDVLDGILDLVLAESEPHAPEGDRARPDRRRPEEDPRHGLTRPVPPRRRCRLGRRRLTNARAASGHPAEVREHFSRQWRRGESNPRPRAHRAERLQA